jgi:hypothetical protein
MARSINYQILCRVHRPCNSSAKGLIIGTVYVYLKNEKLCVEKSLNSSATDKERISLPKEDKYGTVLQKCSWNYWLPSRILASCK